jgi:hypothetical protein
MTLRIKREYEKKKSKMKEKNGGGGGGGTPLQVTLNRKKQLTKEYYGEGQELFGRFDFCLFF